MKAEDYLKLDYPVGFQYDSGGGYFVKVVGLKGCMSQGDTFEEACWMIIDAMTTWLEVALEDTDDIPLPKYQKPIFWDDYTAIMLLRFVRKIASVYEESIS